MLRVFLIYLIIMGSTACSEAATSSDFPLCGSHGTCVFVEPPKDFSQQVEVASCYCEHEGKLLLLLRHPQKPQGNTWCVPGGKLDKGETPIQAVVREVKEETGINLPTESLVYCRKVYVRFPKRDIVLHLFKSHLKKMPRGFDLARDEHTAYRWVTVEQALEMPLIPGGDDCLRLITSSEL